MMNTAGSNECYRYGFIHGCNLDCPVYQSGKCELEYIVKEQNE